MRIICLEIQRLRANDARLLTTRFEPPPPDLVTTVLSDTTPKKKKKPTKSESFACLFYLPVPHPCFHYFLHIP